MVYACSLENYRTLIAFREFESHTLCQSLGSVQQIKTLVLCKVLADKNDPVNYYDPYTLTLKPMCSIIKMGDNLESDRYKFRAVLWVTGDPCKIAVNGFDSHTVHQIGDPHVDYNCYGMFKF